jgi:hypothetical protein
MIDYVLFRIARDDMTPECTRSRDLWRLARRAEEVGSRAEDLRPSRATLWQRAARSTAVVWALWPAGADDRPGEPYRQHRLAHPGRPRSSKIFDRVFQETQRL